MTMDYVVKDINLSDFGRKEINIAETETFAETSPGAIQAVQKCL